MRLLKSSTKIKFYEGNNKQPITEKIGTVADAFSSDFPALKYHQYAITGARRETHPSDTYIQTTVTAGHRDIWYSIIGTYNTWSASEYFYSPRQAWIVKSGNLIKLCTPYVGTCHLCLMPIDESNMETHKSSSTCVSVKETRRMLERGYVRTTDIGVIKAVRQAKLEVVQIPIAVNHFIKKEISDAISIYDSSEGLKSSITLAQYLKMLT